MTTRTNAWRAATGLLVLYAVAACSRAARQEASPVIAAREEHCWWTVTRTGLPLDTVASRYGQAFATVGLPATTIARLGDTVWVRAIPSTLGVRGDAIEARFVAYRKGDSTHLRSFVTMPGAKGSQTIPFCRELGRATLVGGNSAGEPGAEEQLPVWTRRP
jgi:hypothetical protein